MSMKNSDGSIYFRGVSMASVTRDQRWVGRNSFYVEHGDWFVAACAALAAGAFLLLWVLKIPAAPIEETAR
jgi:apolipoprotein N-acyltransferase